MKPAKNAPIAPRRDHLLTRLGGTVTGIGFFFFGAIALAGRAAPVFEAGGDGAWWYGMTLFFAGIVAIVVSWTVRDPNTVWCRQPRRWRHDAKRDS